MSELAVLMKLALSHSIDTSARATLSQQAKKKALKERSLVEELTWKQQVTRLPIPDDRLAGLRAHTDGAAGGARACGRRWCCAAARRATWPRSACATCSTSTASRRREAPSSSEPPTFLYGAFSAAYHLKPRLDVRSQPAAH